MNISVHISLLYIGLIFFGYIWRSGIIGSCAVLFFIFWENSILFFPKMSVTLYSHTKSALELPFLHILTRFNNSGFFLMQAILTGMKWYLIVLLICTSQWLVILNIYSCTCWPFACLFGKMSFHVLCSFLTGLLGFLLLSCLSFFIYFGY